MDKSNWTWYVAGPWNDRPYVREVIAKITAAGWVVNSRWAGEDVTDIDPNDPEAEKKKQFHAARDVEDVAMADGLIYVNSKKSEGKATELGLAIGMLKPIVIIGSGRGREGNIFLNLAIPMYETVEEALAWLDSPEGQQFILYVLDKQYQHSMTIASIMMAEDSGLLNEPEVLAQVEFPSE